MRLARLLAEAAAASPDRRIEWRDQIAPFGRRAIKGVEPWLADSALAAFAIRVIWKVGERGEPEAAVKVLRAARGRLPVHLQGDIDWALRALLPTLRQAAVPPAGTPGVSAPRSRPQQT
jgi:hypothetical protein